MMKHQTYSVLPALVGDPNQQQTVGDSRAPTPLAPQPAPVAMEQARHQPHHLQQQQQHPLRTTPKLAARRHLQHTTFSNSNSNNHHQHLHQSHLTLLQRQRQRQARPRVLRASEYKNLRQVVPSLRRQRDVGKVEVVTEAARYIDHLHKTLIERFVLCGIPDSLKGKFRRNLFRTPSSLKARTYTLEC